MAIVAIELNKFCAEYIQDNGLYTLTLCNNLDSSIELLAEFGLSVAQIIKLIQNFGH